MENNENIIVYDNFATIKKTDRKLIVKTNEVKTFQGVKRLK